jgi:hypothetical protein
MNDLILWGNNVTSFIVVMLCWWLAHAHAGSAYFLRRVLATAYGAFGFTTFGIMLYRNIVDDMPWLAICGKLALIYLFSVLVYRQYHKTLAMRVK